VGRAAARLSRGLSALAVAGLLASPAAAAPNRIAVAASVGAVAVAVAPGALTIDQLAGQRIIYAYAGLTPPRSLLAAIRAGEAAGVIFFADNVGGPSQLQGVVAQLQRADASSPVPVPLLMLVDQEGGAVRRLPGAPVLSEKQIGAAADGLALARQAGTGAARTLRAAGVDVNLAPVLDVFRRTGDFIDAYGRSYSGDAPTVARLGAAFITAQQGLGIAATAKHFPGLGVAGAAQNTDQGPVTLTVGLSRLRAVDESPYRSAIAAGVKLVMTSWATYPALDARRPAGLSAAVIGGELRGRLRFRGVTITDAISAGDLARFGSVAQRGVLAARAGADLVLCSAINPADSNPAQGLSVLSAIASALRRHRLAMAGARAAAARVLALRARP
jgi:beta-N-acetylhexosaminidase